VIFAATIAANYQFWHLRFKEVQSTRCFQMSPLISFLQWHASQIDPNEPFWSQYAVTRLCCTDGLGSQADRPRLGGGGDGGIGILIFDAGTGVLRQRVKVAEWGGNGRVAGKGRQGIGINRASGGADHRTA